MSAPPTNSISVEHRVRDVETAIDCLVPSILRIQIASEVQELLTQKVLNDFATELMQATFSLNGVDDEGKITRKKLADTLQGFNHPVMIDWQGCCKYLVQHFEDLSGKNNLITILNEQNGIIGIAGWEKCGHQKKRQVYEFVHCIVLAAYRGRKLSSRLADAVIKLVHAEAPQAFLLNYTRISKLQENWHRRGARTISPEEHVKIQREQADEESGMLLEGRKKMAEEGWKALLLPVNGKE
jgi:predicted GNAT family N-acyltransferase